MPLDDLKATLDRSFADELWSKDGKISRASWDTAKAVVMGAGILKTDVKYDEIIDMSFVDSIKASLRFASRERRHDRNHQGKKTTMSEPIWNKFLTERDKAVFGNSGYGARGGFGKRPALLIIDVNWAFCGDKPRADPRIDQALAQFLRRGRLGRAALHPRADRQVPRQGRAGDLHHRRAPRRQLGCRLLDAGRTRATTRTQSAPVPNLDGNEIVAPIAPGPQDIVVLKQKPSGFFGTNMASYLTLLGCDSVIVTGTTTSGCVRATVLDAFSLNYRIALAEEGCFDRSQASHAINLCDMNAKYADVVKTSEVLAFLDSLPNGMFDLPSGSKPKAAPKLAASY